MPSNVLNEWVNVLMKVIQLITERQYSIFLFKAWIGNPTKVIKHEKF